MKRPVEQFWYVKSERLCRTLTANHFEVFIDKGVEEAKDLGFIDLGR